MRYSAMVVKLPNDKTMKFKFNTIYNGLKYSNVISIKQLHQLFRLQHSKLKGVKVIKTKFGGVRIIFYGDKELDKFILEAPNGEIISFRDYVNLGLMFSDSCNKDNYTIIDNKDCINNTEITFTLYNNTTVFSVRAMIKIRLLN